MASNKQISTSADTADAIASELVDSTPHWCQRCFASSAGGPIRIALSFRAPRPTGASGFLSSICQKVIEQLSNAPPDTDRSLEIVQDGSADVAVRFWPESKDSQAGVGFEIEIKGYGIQEVGWWSLP